MNRTHISGDRIGKLFLCVLASLVMWPFAVSAQGDELVEFPSRKVTIAGAIGAIEKQTSYLISVDHTGFDVSQTVDLGARQMPLSDALRKMLGGTGRDFVIRGRYILIVPAKEVHVLQEARSEPVGKSEPVVKEVVVPAVEISGITPGSETPVIAIETEPEAVIVNGFSPEEAAELRRNTAFDAIGKDAQAKPMRFGIKTNLLYGAGTLTPNIGLEIGLGKRSSFDIVGAYNWWNMEGTDSDNRKLGHWIIQPEYRWWLCERFNGHFFGIHALGGKFNIAEHRIPLLFGEKNSDKYRYDGWMVGAGVSYGYQLMLGRKWNLEFTVGFGYGRMKYDRYEHRYCGELLQENATRNYFGPTKAGITLVFLIR